jgi:hypothetical protein
VTKGWLADGTIQAASRIDVPGKGAELSAGTIGVGGRAWTQIGGVKSVEVKVDDGAWQQAKLADPIDDNTWRLWSYTWNAKPGDHTLSVRMTSSDGSRQSETAHGVYPGAASGLHSISVHVT